MINIVKIRDIHHLNVAVIESPGFAAPRPCIINKGLVPLGALQAMGPAWTTNFFGARQIFVDKLFDVFVTAEGLAFTLDGCVIAETITQHSISEQERAYALVMESKDAAPVVNTSCLLMRKRGDQNYGHWLVEVLPKLNITRSVCHVSGLVVPAWGGAIDAVIRDSLAVSGPAVPQLRLHHSQVSFFKELIVVSGASEHGTYMSPLLIHELDLIAEKILEQGGKQIYVSRRGSHRSLHQDEQIEEDLQRSGFIVVHPGELSFDEQVATFKGAEVVVGVMGAGMTNIAFAQRGATIINIAPAAMPDTFFYLIATHRNQNYKEVRVPTISGNLGWEEKLKVSSADILHALRLPAGHPH